MVSKRIIIANPTIESINLAKRIGDYSAKYAAGGQLGFVINKVGNEDLTEVYNLAKNCDMEVLGSIPYDENLAKGSITRISSVVEDAVSQLYFRLNLPQENN